MKRMMLGVVAAVAMLGGCAPSASTGVTNQAAATLESYVQAVRTAAAGKSAAAVRGAVQALDAEVEKLVGKGEITSQAAASIENQAGVVRSDFDRANPPASPSTPPTTASPSVTPTTPTATPTVTVTTVPPPPPTTPPITPSAPSTSSSAATKSP